MAIEFDLKIIHPVSTEALLARASASLQQFGVMESLCCDQPTETNWGNEERQGLVRLGQAVAGLFAHKVGEEADLGEDGGYWLTVSAERSRTGGGVFLALIVAAAAAAESGSMVVDESHRLGLGRKVAPGDVLVQLMKVVGVGNLGIIGERLAKSWGLAWPI